MLAPTETLWWCEFCIHHFCSATSPRGRQFTENLALAFSLFITLFLKLNNQSGLISFRSIFVYYLPIFPYWLFLNNKFRMWRTDRALKPQGCVLPNPMLFSLNPHVLLLQAHSPGLDSGKFSFRFTETVDLGNPSVVEESLSYDHLEHFTFSVWGREIDASC